MSTQIGCKSDCQFSQNSDRECTLSKIQLVQSDKFSPKLVCGQYVSTQVSLQKHGLTDLEQAKSFGMMNAMRGKLGG